MWRNVVAPLRRSCIAAASIADRLKDGSLRVVPVSVHLLLTCSLLHTAPFVCWSWLAIVWLSTGMYRVPEDCLLHCTATQRAWSAENPSELHASTAPERSSWRVSSGREWRLIVVGCHVHYVTSPGAAVGYQGTSTISADLNA